MNEKGRSVPSAENSVLFDRAAELVSEAEAVHKKRQVRRALELFEAALAVHGRAISEERLAALRKSVCLLEEGIQSIRELFQNGQFPEAKSRALELQKAYSDGELQAAARDAAEREHKVQALEARLLRAKQGARPREAMDFLRQIVELQPFRADSLQLDVESQEVAAELAVTDLAEAKNLKLAGDWANALRKIEESMGRDSRSTEAHELREQVQAEIASQIEGQGLSTLIRGATAVLLGLVTAAVVTFLFLG